jgi:predicted lipoprotein with Yx(FWY)xxD motif
MKRNLFTLTSVVIALVASVSLAGCATVTTTMIPGTVTLTTTQTVTGSQTTSTATLTVTLPPTNTTVTVPVTVTAPVSTTMPPITTPAGANYTINTASSPTLGTYLAGGTGMTLYYFTKDTLNKSNASAAVIAIWPVFYTPSVNVPASLNVADFGVITRSDGSQQTTFRGWPLYYYASDKYPGDTMGQGIGGIWFVVNPVYLAPPGSST